MSQKSYNATPTVYLVATPIGNMNDITFRAIDTLKNVSVIFSEDTRTTSLLLRHFDIKNKMIANHQHNEIENKDKLLSYLNNNLSVAVVTDRGTPAISDPGYQLAQIAIENNFNVVSIPGPTALINALIVSGIEVQPFTFYGFLNCKTGKRIKELEELKALKTTIIFYEAPHRLKDMLNDLLTVFGNRKISISREITKKFEEIFRGSINEVLNQLPEQIKGEIVVVVEKNKDINLFEHLSLIEHINLYIKEGYDNKEAIKLVAKERNINKNEVYNKYHRGDN